MNIEIERLNTAILCIEQRVDKIEEALVALTAIAGRADRASMSNSFSLANIMLGLGFQPDKRHNE